MIRLHVNVDHVATLRNARGTPYPDPVRAAQTAPNVDTEAAKKAYYSVVRQMVDEEYTLYAYCS